ncbi:UNVERIFIED_CONTAM: hypothetical protein H355_004960 [Colinus virginianus]|nr:hypothetical protein H355_004960 [Colinus virginianus]
MASGCHRERAAAAAAAGEEEALRKLLVRLRYVQEGKRPETLVQTLSDLLELAARQSELTAYHQVKCLLLTSVAPESLQMFGTLGVGIIQVKMIDTNMGWSLLCKLIEICPSTLQNIALKDVGKDWEVLGVHQQILKMLTIHKGNVDLSVIGLKTLNLLLMSVPEEQLTEFVESKDHMIILEIFKEFPEKEEVILPALYSLHSLAGPPSNVEVLMSGNVRCYNVIVEMMKNFPNSETVQEVCCCLLQKLTLGNFYNILVLHKVPEVIVKAVEMYSENAKLQAAALSCLALLNTKNDRNSSSRNMGDAAFTLTVKVMKSQCLLEGTHSLVLGALNRFIGNPSIQRCGLKLLTSVAECTGALEILTQQGATDTVLHTLQMYPDEQDIQSLGLSLLLFLLTRKSLCIATMHVLATVLVSTLRRFKEVTEIQMHGFRAILSILGFSPCFAKLLIHESFDTVIFYQMSMCFTNQRDRQFQSLCCKCFAKIAENDELKNMMLEKACIECNSIMAECLLLLGADINKKTKTNSLIYQVCEKGNNPKLVELLLANGAREQDVRSALTISIKRGDSQIISLLLKKLSLDVANSSICLGGFGIGRLEPSWLIPLFPDKLTPPRRQNAGSALARMVLKYQMKNISEDRSESCSDLNFSEDGVDKNYDWNFISDPLVDTVFPLSDDIDSEGSEGSLFRKKKSNSIAVADLYCREIAFQRGSPTLPRHSYSVNLKCLTYLDLHSNRFTSFPTYLLKMNCIMYLDISRNDIGPSFALDPHLRCPTLKQLNLSYNQLMSIPEFLANVAENLEQLLLEGNKISCLSSPLSLKELKILNISKNNISSLAENVFMSCTKLELFNARMNALEIIPDLSSSITTLKLSQNCFINVPETILLLPHLRSVDLSQNKILSLPGPVHWKSLNLRELLFNHNQIGVLDLSEKACAWSRLEKLHLSNNNLKEIPPQIGFLENLTSLDVSHNPELRFFPDEMGRLSKIWDLPLEGLHLNLDFKHVGCKARDIIRFLQQRLKKAVPYNRMKLMIVGNTGSGKTTLLQQLMKCKRTELGCPKATVGIDVKDWIIQGKGKMKKELILNVWDFGGCILLGQVVDHIDSLMEEWFPGLLDIDVCGEGETLLKKWALYSFEDGEEHQKILLDDLLKKAEEGDLLVNPDQPRHTIPIAQIAPDLILADLPRNIMLNSDELEFDKAPEFLLGDGGFGSVYRASYGGEEVAVKIFNKHTSLRLLRQELAVLCHLHHPSLVSLLAAAVRPRMLVMELALKGSLDRLLQQDKANLTRTLQHRIALHVADGLRYLHSAMIIYRDLKPHNVLLFTLYPNAAVIAKIADYGIAQYCCRMGIKTSEGTPGFRAPEVARGNVIYNQQADVYSFGLLLYDILTGGGRIMEGVKFPNEFDELAIQGKLPDPVKEYGCAPWPKVEHLIKKCLKENPQERPTSSQVYEILNSAELICLMRYISIPSTSTAECMVAANQSCKKAGVWIGNGNTEKAQLSFVNLNTEGHTCEDIADSKILSLALVTLPTEKENWIVAGTHSGSLWAVNTEDETRRHRLQKMSDSITCLYCNSLSKQRFCHNAYSDANIISIAVDKSIYLAKKNSHFVEIWDKKTEKLSELIDCAHFLKDEVEKLNKESKHNVAYSGRVKTICLQKNTALWVGTGGGHILLLDLSTRRPVRVIDNFCDSIRVMLTAQLGGLKNVVLVLGYCYKSDTEDDKYHKELQSCVSVWDINLPHEVQNLKKHIEVRQELAEKMKSFTLD